MTITIFGEVNLINLQLVIECCIAAFFFAWPVYEKRGMWLLRAGLSLLVLACAGYFFPSYYNDDSSVYTFLYWTMMYMSLLLFTIPFTLMTYKLKPINALMIALVAYAVHHVSNVLSSNIYDLIFAFTSLPSGWVTAITWICNILCMILVYFVFFHYYLSASKRNIVFVYDNKQLALFAFLVVLFAIVTSACARIFYYAQELRNLYFVSLWSNLASCIMILLLFFNILRHNKLQQDLQTEERLFNQSKRQYTLSKENIESLNIKFHDLKYRIQLLTDSQSGIDKSSLQDIYDDLILYDSSVKTGNKPLDVVLTEYAISCQAKKIPFTAMADGKKLDFMSPYEIYSLFGNAISNAIEASEALEEGMDKGISLTIEEKSGLVVVELENYFNPKKIKRGKKGLQTSKKDKLNHGYGYTSMSRIVDKYDGSLSYSIDGNIFILNMVFPVSMENCA